MLANNMFAKRNAAKLLTQQGLRAMSSSFVTLPKNTNQARGLAEYAIDFMKMENKRISDEVFDRV